MITKQSVYRNVIEEKGCFRAIAKKGLATRVLGRFPSAEVAAEAVDRHEIETIGLKWAYARLNFPEQHKQAHDQFIQAEQERNRKTAEEADARARAIKISPELESKIIAAFDNRQSVEAIASRHGLHIEVVRNVLLTERTRKDRELGIVAPTEIDAGAIRAEASKLRQSGLSIRAIAERLGIDRKSISRWFTHE